MKTIILILLTAAVSIYAYLLFEEVVPISLLSGSDIVDIKPVSVDEILMVTQGAGIIQSNNGGINIRGVNLINQDLFNRNFGVLNKSGQILTAGGAATFFGYSPGVFESTDGGNNWTYLGLDGRNVTSIIRDQQRFLVGTRLEGVYSYNNGNFAPLNNGLTSAPTRTIYSSAKLQRLLHGGDNGIHSFNDSDQKWEPTPFTAPVDKMVDGDITLYIASNNKIFETSDLQNFGELPPLAQENFHFTSLKFDSPNLYVTCYPDDDETSFPLVNSFNINSQTWSGDTDGLPENYGIPNVLEIGFGFKYLGTTTGLYKSTLSGAWQSVTENFPGLIFTSASYNPYNNHYYAGGGLGYSWVANDINGTWFRNDKNLKLDTYIREFVHFPGGETIAIQGDDIKYQPALFQPFESRKGGLNAQLFTSAAYNQTDNILAVASNLGIHISNDMGLSYMPTNVNEFTDKIIFSEATGNFYAQGFNGIRRAEGSGENFEYIITNITPVDFNIKDIQNGTLAVSTFDDFLEYDFSGNQTSLGNVGLGFGGFADNLNYSISYGTWSGTRENMIYQYNYNDSRWDLSAETDKFILAASIKFNFDRQSGLAADDVLLVGTYGGGMLSNAVVTNVEINELTVPKKFMLNQNYPNPFNPSTVISFSLPAKSQVIVKIFDVLGRELFTLINEEKSAGNHSVRFDGTGLVSGIYFYRIDANDFSETKKMVLLR